MSDNKYKYKTEKEKKKCENIIEKLYGDNYYFIHGTKKKYIEDILKSNKIKIGTNSGNMNYSYTKELLPYVYCNIEFDNVPINHRTELPLFHYILLLHPKILYENETIIFNKEWQIDPNEDSIYINKEDTDDIKKNKIKEIKNQLKEFKKRVEKSLGQNSFDQNYHEVLFTKDINLKDNLIGIVCNNQFFNYTEYIEELLKKYEYNNIKIYDKITEFPLLCDLLI